MTGYCVAHLERAGIEIPAFKNDLCRKCFDGVPIKPKRSPDRVLELQLASMKRLLVSLRHELRLSRHSNAQMQSVIRELLPTSVAQRNMLRGAVKDSLISAVAREFGVLESDIFSRVRRATNTMPRHMLMYIMHHHAEFSYPEIAQLFGGLHHTSVLHGTRKIEALLPQRPDLVIKRERIISTVSTGVSTDTPMNAVGCGSGM